GPSGWRRSQTGGTRRGKSSWRSEALVLQRPAIMNSNRATVLILSSDPGFSRELTESWAKTGDVPEFVLLEENLCHELRGDSYDLAVADAASSEKHSQLKKTLAAIGKPAIVVYRDNVHRNSPADIRSAVGSIVELSRQPSIWPEMPVLLGREIL